MKIDSFSGLYRFLSNFYPAIVRVPVFGPDGTLGALGAEVPTTEHAYQAAKARLPNQAIGIMLAKTPGAAKLLGSRVLLRRDWEEIKVPVMRNLLGQKFARGSVLAQALLATGNSELIEGNHWGDRFWGVYEGEGQNWLGKLLMERRQALSDAGEPVVAMDGLVGLVRSVHSSVAT